MKSIRSIPPVQIYVIHQMHDREPNEWVVKCWTMIYGETLPEPVETAVCSSLFLARSTLPKGLIRQPKSIKDDPSIVEVWL